MTTPYDRLVETVRAGGGCAAFPAVGTPQLLAVLGYAQDGWLNDEVMDAYVRVLEQHYAHDRRLSFYNQWFVEVLTRTTDEVCQDVENPGPWVPGRAETRPEHLARIHNDPKSGYVELDAENSVCFFSVYEDSAPITGDVSNRRLGNGHFWVAIAYMRESFISCWDSLGPRYLSLARQFCIANISLYLNARLRLRSLPKKTWRTNLTPHAGNQHGPSCGIYVLKTIELAAATPERVWVSTLTQPFVTAYRRQVACSLHEARLLTLSEIELEEGQAVSSYTTAKRKRSETTTTTTSSSSTIQENNDGGDDESWQPEKRCRQEGWQPTTSEGWRPAASAVVSSPRRELVATEAARALAELLLRQQSPSYVGRDIVLMSETHAGFEQAHALMAALLEHASTMRPRIVHMAFRDDRLSKNYVFPASFKVCAGMPLPSELSQPSLFVALSMSPASVQSRLYVNHLQPWAVANACEFWDVWTSGVCAHVHARCFLHEHSLEQRPDLYALSCLELVGSPADLRRQSSPPYRGLDSSYDCFPLCVL